MLQGQPAEYFALESQEQQGAPFFAVDVESVCCCTKLRRHQGPAAVRQPQQPSLGAFVLGLRLVAPSEKQAGFAAEEKAAADGPSSDGDGERLEPNQIRPGSPAQDVSQ